MSPLAWAGQHPMLLAALLTLAAVFGVIVTVAAILWASPETDLSRSPLDQGGRA